MADPKPRKPRRFPRISPRFAATTLVVLLCVTLYIHRLKLQERQLETLFARLTAHKGSCRYQLSPLGEFVSTHITSWGVKQSPKLHFLSNRILYVPPGFEFTEAELQLLARTRAVKEIRFGEHAQLPLILQRLRLEKLEISGYRLTADEYAAIRSHTSIEHLTLTMILFDQTLIDVIQGLPRLKVLTLKFCTKDPDSKLIFNSNQRFRVRIFCRPSSVTNSSNYIDSLRVDYHQLKGSPKEIRAVTSNPPTTQAALQSPAP
ncbi:MAG: hypothetical protein KDA68_04125 [Planctomycetaceae bacterium]|nr:hypothetical protein [Planctomycetaceae bacterium]